SSDADDGASNCTSAFGTDGKLSLSEAVRLANSMSGFDSITFSGAMTIASSGAYSLDSDLDIFAPAGVIVVGKTFAVPTNGTQIRIYGLELSGQTAPFALTGNTAGLQLFDVYFHDLPGITDTRGTLYIEQSRFSGCASACIAKSGTNPGLITLRFSELKSSPGQAAVAFDT